MREGRKEGREREGEQKEGVREREEYHTPLVVCGSFQVKSTQLLTPMFQFFVILCNFVALIKLYKYILY